MTELVCKLDNRITADNTGFTSGGGGRAKLDLFTVIQVQ